MAVSLCRIRLGSPVQADRQDFSVIEDGQVIGRIYEVLHVPADVGWFCSITEHVDPALGIRTHNRVASLQVAKEQFKSSWSKLREANKEQE
jgi:hypothetical protein